jgi:beta-glucosidase/6-phospho-beta-glucosidase/beta-galactosidase
LTASRGAAYDPAMRRTLAALALACSAGSALAGPVARPFPDGFLWGTAISGFQSDMGQGAPVDAGSDWWTWVRDPQNLAQGRVSGDLPEVGGPGFWLRYDDDARLARRGLKANAFRMGIEWSRLFPTSTAGVDASGGFTPAVLAQLDALADQSAVAHYRDVFAALRARGLVPLVTLNHFSLPTWLHDPIAVRDAFAGVDPFAGAVPPGLSQAGWLDADIVGEFAKLAAYAGWKFGDQVDLWATLNEPVVVIVSGFANAPGVGGNFPPGVFNLPAILTLMPNLVAAHARGYDAVHATDTVDADGDGTAAAVGAVHNMVAFDPKNPASAADQAGAAHADYLFNRVFPVAVTQGRFDANLDGDTDDPGETRPDLARSDFLGVNYYLRATATGVGAPLSPVLPLFDFLPTQSYAAGQCPSTCTEFGWEIYPEGLRRVLTFAGTLGVPLYITENGIADADDDQRADYLARHLAVVQDVVADGVADVRGYFEWSLTDNFEWSSGYFPRFGAYAVDPATGKRVRRPSSRVFRTIARRNGIPASLVRRFGL